jgi:tetratricopeptide (TPR) repeat protein
MLRGLQERGDLVQDEQGRWVERPALDWETLPARVEGVIGERIGRLSATLREALKVASVEGELFTAEVVAQVQAIDEPEMVRQLSSELDRQHRLVRGQGSQRLSPGGQRLSQYRFRHILFQRYVYNSLDEVERVYLHEAVGNALEQLYEGQTEQVAVELARHFQTAGLVLKAIDYLHQAGNRAVRLSANEAAIGHLNEALQLLETLPDTPERAQQELTLQIALSAPLAMTKGYGASDMIQVYTRARALARQVGDTSQLFPVLRGLWNYNLNQANLQKALALVQQLFGLAQRVTDQVLLMQAHWMFGETYFHLGELVNARTHLEQALALYNPQAYRSHPFRAVQEPRVVCLLHLATVLWLLGYPDQALTRVNEALTLAQALPRSISLAHTLVFVATIHLYRREGPIAQEKVEAAIAFSNELGFAVVSESGRIVQGSALVEQGMIAEGLSRIRHSLDAHQATGASIIWRPEFICWLAEAHLKANQVDEGLGALAEAVAIVNRAEKHYYEADIYRLKGELLLRAEGRGRIDELTPEAFFLRAVDIARRQSAKSLELRAVMSLCRLWRDQGKKKEACQVLAELYGWFSEGFDTGDLREAKTLLEELS